MHDLIHTPVNVSDIDECAEQTDTCDHNCYNTIGSYLCNCSGPGYRLQNDDSSCQSEMASPLY